jgi:hypothetical protein
VEKGKDKEMTKKGTPFVKLPTSGVVKVFSINDKTNCKHENLVKYCIRDNYQYYFCLDCKNLVREEIYSETEQIKRGE